MKGKAQPKPGSSIFIGNARTKEVHHSGYATKQCQVDEITVNHKRIFQTLDEARESGFDMCARCFDSKK